jgi:hypothetical protein
MNLIRSESDRELTVLLAVGHNHRYERSEQIKQTSLPYFFLFSTKKKFTHKHTAGHNTRGAAQGRKERKKKEH